MDFCEQQTTRPSQDLQQLMKSTLQHDWQKAHDQGQLDHIPNTLMMSGNLEGVFLLRFQYIFYSKYNQLNKTRFFVRFEQYIQKIGKSHDKQFATCNNVALPYFTFGYLQGRATIP